MNPLPSFTKAVWAPGSSFPGCNQFRMSNTLRAVAVGVFDVALVAATITGARAQTQSSSNAPYASIASRGADYSGPGREAAYDLIGPAIPIGLLVPLGGPRRADGEAIVAAAELAIADAAQNPLPGGRKLVLKIGDESGPPWSGATNALTRLVLEEKAVAVITSANGATAHLSEQVGNRIGVATLTLASDKTTTQIDLPWIFRLVPSDALEAQTIAETIYRLQGFQRVLLVTEDDHDGRRGGLEFLSAARALGAPPPISLVLESSRPDVEAFEQAIRAQAPETIVLWTSAPRTQILIQAMRATGTAAPVHLSQQAAQTSSGLIVSPDADSLKQEPGQAAFWTVAWAGSAAPLHEDFARRYQQATGSLPSAAAAEAYDAIQLVASALRDAGANRARVRDQIARTRNWPGVSGTISFDAEGNNNARVRLVRLQ